VKIKALYTYCEQVGRREKDYEMKVSQQLPGGPEEYGRTPESE
jgi:hypothetical protein